MIWWDFTAFKIDVNGQILFAIEKNAISQNLSRTTRNLLLLDYLKLNNLISRQQHGFLSRHSTRTQLLECLNDWTLAIDNHQGVAVGYIDFFRAFDSVVHNKLLVKLASYGIANDVLAFIKDFLTDRTQNVVVEW